MSRNYDNWERLVAAVIKREEIWELCHQPSRTPSICSEASSSFSSSFRLTDLELEKKQESVRRLVSVKGVLKSKRELGKGRFGTSNLTRLHRNIKISDQEFLPKGSHLVMKKLAGEVTVTEEEFNNVIGIIRHENVVAPRAYYFSNDTNDYFIFNDFHTQGSLYDMLRTERIVHRLGWGSRLKIAIGAARGIAHIHSQCGGKLAHGNITSSNIFLNSEQYGCVSDFGLAAIMKMPPKLGGLHYHALKYELKNASHESDVYCFGAVLLELLTGRSPVEAQGSHKNLDIDSWARSTAPKDSFLMFDHNLVGRLLCDESDMFGLIPERDISGLNIGIEEFRVSLCSCFYSMNLEMEEMSRVARRCLAKLPQDRPKMFDVVLMLENIPNLHNGPRTPIGKIMSEIM